MNGPLIILGLGAVGAWWILRHTPKASAYQFASAPSPALLPPMRISSTPAAGSGKIPTLDDSPSAHAGNYLTHLTNNVTGMQTFLDAERSGDPNAVIAAEADMSGAIDTLTVQKDMNVLGATPPLVESGVLDARTRDAIDSFQRQAGLEPTGQMNAPTALELRKTVAVATAQGSLA